MKIKVGLITKDLSEWAGGRGLLKAMLNGLIATPDDSFEYILFFRLGPFRSSFFSRVIKKTFSLERDPGEMAIPLNLKELYSYKRYFKTVFYYGDDVEGLLKKLSIEVILPVFPSLFNSRLSCRKVGYIYDFQHEYLPAFFSSSTIEMRRKEIKELMKTVNSLVLTSATVDSDVQRLYPQHKRPTFLLPLYPLFLDDISSDEIEKVKAKYGISFPYFMNCNQFWRHKGHDTLFRAFQITAFNNPTHLVCTGVLEGCSDEKYKMELRKLIDDNSARIHVLGVLPKREQLALIKGAVALIQPSLFEGGAGGGAVAEALVYGVPCLVSDISIHTELPSTYLHFFKTGDERDLASKIQILSTRDLQRPSEKELVRFREELLKTMGDSLNKSLHAAVNAKKVSISNEQGNYV